MLDFIKENRQFVLLVLVWILVGYFTGVIPAYAVVTFSLFALFNRERYAELFIAFFIVLMLSDNRFRFVTWTDDYKNVFVLALGAFMLKNKSFSIDYQFVRLFLPFFILAFILIFYNVTPLVSLEKSVSYFLLILVVPNYVITAHKKNGNEFFKSLIWAVILVLSYGILLKYISPRFATLEGRFMGTFGNPNGLGAFCMMFFILTSVLQEKFNLFDKNELRIILGVILLSTIFSGSRTAIFSISIFMLFRYFNNISPSVGFAMLLLFIGGYEILFSNFQTIVNAMGLGEYFRLDTIQDGSGRFIAWNFAYENVKEAWWFGRGFSYTEYLFKYYEYELSLLGHQGNAHNSYLTIWLDTGLVGLILFLRGFLLLFFKGAKLNRTSLGVLYAVLFSVYFESWLIGSLNPITIQVYIILTVLASDYFNQPKKEEFELQIQSTHNIPAIS